MFNSNSLTAQDLFANANTLCQIPPILQNTISTAISSVPYTPITRNPKVDTYCPMYPCPHKDLFRIARQIDKIPGIECQYRYDSHTFVIKDTERNRLGILSKDTKANQIILQCDGYSDRLIRFITLDIDCDLLTLIKMERYSPLVRGLYRVNSVE